MGHALGRSEFYDPMSAGCQYGLLLRAILGKA